MSDPLQLLPNEIWNMCIRFAIAGKSAGPLEFIMVSKRWERILLNSPSLWTQIYIQNGEDELARISTFLHLSKRSPLHIDIMTVLPTVDGLRLVAEHISRVKTISIRPGASNIFTALHAEQWKRAAAYVLENLSNGMQLCDVESPSCPGVSIWDGTQMYYHVIRLQFTVAARVARIDELNDTWDDHLTNKRIILDPKEEDDEVQATSISSIATLASQDRFHDVVRIAIPSLVKSLDIQEDEAQLRTFHLISNLSTRIEYREAVADTIPLLIKLVENEEENDHLRSGIAELIGELANYVEFRETITSTIPSIVKLLKDESSDVRVQSVEVIVKLANHVEFRGALASMILSLIELLEDEDWGVRVMAVKLIGKRASHAQFHEAIATMVPSFIQLLQDEDEGVRLKADEVIGELANHVELREAIANMISSSIQLFEDENESIRLMAIELIDSLANHGKGQLKNIASHLTRHYEAQFREAIASMIPFLSVLLDDEEVDIRRKTLELFGKLADHAESREAITSMMI